MDNLNSELKLMKDQLSHINHQLKLRFTKKKAAGPVIEEQKKLEKEVNIIVDMVKENDIQVDRLFRLAVASFIKKIFFWIFIGILLKLGT